MRAFRPLKSAKLQLIAVADNRQIWDAGGVQKQLADLFAWLHGKRKAEVEPWTRFWTTLREHFGWSLAQRYCEQRYRELHDGLVAAGFITADPVYADVDE